MSKLDPLLTFVEVVNAGSFTGAAERLNMPRSTVSLHVKKLETSLETRLLKRSTRSLSLTEDGRRLFEQASEGLSILTRTLDSIRDRPGALNGLIRLTAPADFPSETLAAAMAAFQDLHPNIRFEITLTNATLDLVADNVDIAIRISRRGGTERVERWLQDIAWQFCASAEWVARNGAPQTVADIRDFISPMPGLKSFLEQAVLGEAKLPDGRIMADNQGLIRDLVLQGRGVGLLPKGMTDDAIADGRVVVVLDDAVLATTRLNLTFPTRADMVPRVRAFADYYCRLFHA
ncbi:LysR family transcriptional regulator [Martelella sp. HB161492]|uniref:LysR family transcriptional regulator n=1 Tax=Martelella sp. HB161492 TaxID=2720726 RepID=UPI00159281E1|nr:LysR family transcriptional regulator [Martelella sp. HB161492]